MVIANHAVCWAGSSSPLVKIVVAHQMPRITPCATHTLFPASYGAEAILSAQLATGRTSLQTRAYSGSEAAPSISNGASTSKCPVARIQNGMQNLLQKFSFGSFDYHPYSSGVYQVWLMLSTAA